MDKSPSSPRPFSAPRYALTLLAVLLAWTGLYVSIQPLATWLTFDLLSLTPGGAPGLALEFFLYDSAKILLLLVLMVCLLRTSDVSMQGCPFSSSQV